MRIKLLVALTFVTGVALQQHSIADEEFSLVINPFTGAASLRNDATTAVDLDGYYVTSAGSPVLNPGAWSSLAGNSVTGWTNTASGGDRLGEVNLFGSLAIAGGESASIGNPYTAFSPVTFGAAEPALRNLDFSYTLADESSARIGDVEFSARNTIVLVVDPVTGNASLENQSSFNVNIDSYLVTSTAGVLDTVGWSPLASADTAWTSATGAVNRLAEGNLFSSTTLTANGGSLALGSPIDPALLNDETDLSLDFTAEGIGTIAGGVLFAAAATSADFDNDGNVDSDDLNGPTDGWQARYGSDLNGSGFLSWQRQFEGSASLAPTTTAVPEPTSIILVLSASLIFSANRRQR
ncbi:PEP-CTERM sorting domain-containing protein [Adhaeretor mobilis]|uniref:PEP-CTERM protein-sorting domain-containing protein n=1 Tax=Adhaeretor mobilis TaxID=1930276 RepID=A0A517MPX2_9BACT|nr:PEP-CTERM sorting domain-containing protein [Adhaeretor mobilis]QDS96930.1 hypothetical protein HG15A2_01890 [Adhaeretor mobilis]